MLHLVERWLRDSRSWIYLAQTAGDVAMSRKGVGQFDMARWKLSAQAATIVDSRRSRIERLTCWRFKTRTTQVQRWSCTVPARWAGEMGLGCANMRIMAERAYRA